MSIVDMQNLTASCRPENIEELVRVDCCGSRLLTAEQIDSLLDVSGGSRIQACRSDDENFASELDRALAGAPDRMRRILFLAVVRKMADEDIARELRVGQRVVARDLRRVLKRCLYLQP